MNALELRAPKLIEGAAVRRGRRALLVVLAGLAAIGVPALFGVFVMLARPFGERWLCAGCAVPDPGSAVWRNHRVVARITQLAPPTEHRPVWMALAFARGPVADSARGGALVAYRRNDATSGQWSIDLIPRDSMKGVEVVARLVLVAGESPIPVYGMNADR